MACMMGRAAAPGNAPAVESSINEWFIPPRGRGWTVGWGPPQRRPPTRRKPVRPDCGPVHQPGVL